MSPTTSLGKQTPMPALSRRVIQAALDTAGAFSDLDWEETPAALDRIRHERRPTALARNLTVVTIDSDFQRVPDLPVMLLPRGALP